MNKAITRIILRYGAGLGAGMGVFGVLLSRIPPELMEQLANDSDVIFVVSTAVSAVVAGIVEKAYSIAKKYGGDT